MAKKLEFWVTVKNMTAAGFSQVSAGLKGLQRGVSKTVGAIVSKFKYLAAAGGAALVSSVREGNKFLTKMQEVSTMMGEGSNVDKFTKDVLKLSGTIGKTTDELAGGLYQALSAGVPEDNALSFLETASRAAIAGVTDVETSVDTLSTIINAYGMKASEAEKISDLLFTTVKGGKTTFSELGNGIGQVAGIAAQADIPIEELLSSIATMTKQGIGTDKAMTGLRSAILAVTAPSEALEKQFKKMGTTGEQLVKEKGLVGAFKAVGELAGGSTEKMKKLIPSLESIPTILALSGKNAKMAKRDLDSMADSGGKAADAFDKMNKFRHWTRFWETIKSSAITFGKTLDKLVAPLVDTITKKLETFRESGQLEAWAKALHGHLETALGFVEEIFGGGEGREKALFQLKSVGGDIGNKIKDILKRHAPDIGAAIAKGIKIGAEDVSGLISEGSAKERVSDMNARARERLEQNVRDKLKVDPKSAFWQQRARSMNIDVGTAQNSTDMTIREQTNVLVGAQDKQTKDIQAN